MLDLQEAQGRAPETSRQDAVIRYSRVEMEGDYHGIHYEDLATLSLWVPLYYLHGSQESEVLDGSAKFEHEAAAVVGLGEGL